jgi:two-component system LytT family response regulator
MLTSKKIKMNFINIPNIGGIRLVQPENIIRIEASSNYSKIYFSNAKPMTVAKVLHWFEDQLPPEMFARIHRSHLVNRLFMQEINGSKNNMLLLNNGESITISRRKKAVLAA